MPKNNRGLKKQAKKTPLKKRKAKISVVKNSPKKPDKKNVIKARKKLIIIKKSKKDKKKVFTKVVKELQNKNAVVQVEKEKEKGYISDDDKEQKEFALTKEELEALDKKKREYWTEGTEAAVKQYLIIDFNYYQVRIYEHYKKCKEDKKEVNKEYIAEMERKYDESLAPEVVEKRNAIYYDHLQKPVNKLVENIIYNFKLFRPGTDAKTLHDDCVSAVFDKLSHFNPERYTKSFSYYGTVAKHYLQGQKKDEDKKLQTHLDYDAHKEEADQMETEEIGQKDASSFVIRLFNFTIDSIDKEMKNGKMSPNDIKVGFAILETLKNHKDLQLYLKNEIYQLIREATQLPTKDITYSLSRYRALFKVFREKFIKMIEDEDNGFSEFTPDYENRF